MIHVTPFERADGRLYAAKVQTRHGAAQVLADFRDKLVRVTIDAPNLKAGYELERPQDPLSAFLKVLGIASRATELASWAPDGEAGWGRASAAALRRLARHEAGHAVATAVLFGRGAVRSVRAEPPQDPGAFLLGTKRVEEGFRHGAAGLTVVRRHLLTRRSPEALGTVAYAGVAAEAPGAEAGPLPPPWPREPFELAEADLERWTRTEQDRYELACWHAERTPWEWDSDAYRRAWAIVAEHSAAIDAMTALLAEHESLPGAVVDDLVRRGGELGRASRARMTATQKRVEKIEVA